VRIATICGLFALAASPALAEEYRFRAHFAWGSATLDVQNSNIVGIQAEVAITCRPSKIVVAGHADTSEDNVDALSLARATAVRAELVKSGVSPSAMAAEGRGDREPAVPTADNVREEKNRRAEVILSCTSPPG
jgi:outer membrane protein OmpA-like peptidoglycan-associated protein